MEYFPFGESWVSEHSNTQRTPYLYTGKELDEETGLYYFGARYYDPRTSVWQSADPILGAYLDGFPNSGVYSSINTNLYRYAGNNPIIYNDPTGMFDEETGTIEKGDTLSGISKQTNVSINDIMSENPNIKDPDAIYAGDALRIPGAQGKSTTKGNSAASGSSGCSIPMLCAMPTVSDPFGQSGNIATVSGMALATKESVMMANGRRIPRLPLHYGMDINSYRKSVTASKYLGRVGNTLGYFNYGLESYNYTVSMNRGDYRSARKSATSGFYGALMLAPPHLLTVPVGITGLLLNENYHDNPMNP